MFKATVLKGGSFNYHPKNHPAETREAFELWFTFDGIPFSFKMAFFNEADIAKAKAAAASGKANFGLVPNRNTAPEFVLE